MSGAGQPTVHRTRLTQLVDALGVDSQAMRDLVAILEGREPASPPAPVRTADRLACLRLLLDRAYGTSNRVDDDGSEP